MDAAQNTYVTFDYCSPMVLLGSARWQPERQGGVYATLEAEAASYADLLLLADSPDEVAAFIRATPPRKPRPR